MKPFNLRRLRSPESAMRETGTITRQTVWRSHALPLTLLAVLTLGFFTPRLFGRTYSAVGHHQYAIYPWVGVTAPNYSVWTRGYRQTDHAETYYPLSVFATQAWRSGEPPYWFPYSFGGLPIMELGMTSVLYPPRLLLLFLFDPIWQHDLMMMAHLLAAGWLMYALLRVWGANAAGGMLAACVWQFNGQNTFWLVIEQMAIVAAWCPLMLLAATLAVRRHSWRWAVLAGLAVGVALYSGGTLYVYMSGLLLLVWYGTDAAQAAWQAWRVQQPGVAWQSLALPVTSLLIALLIGLAYWLPLLRVLSEVSRQSLPLDVPLSYAFAPGALLKSLVFPRSALDVAAPPDLVGFVFAGLLPVALGLLAVGLSRTRHVRLALAFALGALLMMLGVRWFYGLLAGTVPFISVMFPYQFTYLYGFALAVLAGFGLSALTERWATEWRRWRWCAAALVMVGLLQSGLLVWAFVKVFELRAAQPWLRAASHLFSARGLVLWALLALLSWLAYRVGTRAWHRYVWQSDWRAQGLGYGLALVAAFDLLLFAWLTVPFHLADPAWFYPPTPLVKHLQGLPPDGRMLALQQNQAAWAPPVFGGKSGAVFRLPMAHGYESLVPARQARLWWTVVQGGVVARPADLPKWALLPYFMHDRLPAALLEKLSVKWLIAPPQVEPRDAGGRNLVTDGSLHLIYQGPDGWVYENSRALPRAFIVPRAQVVAGAEQALETLVSAGFDVRRAALFEQPLPADEAALLRDEGNAALGTARIVHESLNEVELETSSPAAGVLVLNDSWASSWHVTVDGVERPVHCVNYQARGVLLPGGPHRVVFRYRPRLLQGCLAVSGLSLALCCAWLLVTPWRALARRRKVEQT